MVSASEKTSAFLRFAGQLLARRVFVFGEELKGRGWSLKEDEGVRVAVGTVRMEAHERTGLIQNVCGRTENCVLAERSSNLRF